MSSLHRAIRGMRRPSRRATIFIVIFVIAVAAFVTGGLYWWQQRNAANTKPELSQTEYRQRAEKYIGDRSIANGTFLRVNRLNTTVEIATPEGQKTFKYDDNTVFARGIEYEEVDPTDITEGQTVAVTIVTDTYAEVVWLPE